MIDTLGEPAAVALVGLFGGVLLGLAARLGRFCTLGAIEDALYGGDGRRLRMWGVAIGVAAIATWAATARGWVTPGDSAYLATAWNPWASVLGGLVFGYGMALAGNCGFGALARVGGGDFRAFVIVLVMGLAAWVVLAGPLAEARLWLFPERPAAGAPAGLAHTVAGWNGIAVPTAGLVLGALILLAALSDRAMLASPRHVFWGAAVGLAVVSGWIGTAWVAQTGFAATPLRSHTFAAPLGETMLYLMTASARPLSFGVGSVAGVLIGAFVGSLFKGHFRWEACEDPRELRRQMTGAALMGGGAVVAMGCTVGQGLSAFSLLAVSAPVTMAAIFVGAALGLRQLITGLLPAE
ncbi:YeeE/YedE family protein [Rhodobacteraceae bacterium CCMM004]|nr:YeeE/YedE family protein [Rhodobacteraceae bacterium CCMM004]